jgi:hypothetical protein
MKKRDAGERDGKLTEHKMKRQGEGDKPEWPFGTYAPEVRV